MTGLFPAVVFSLALISFGVKTESKETRQLAEKGRRGLGQWCCPHLPVWVGKGILGLLFRWKQRFISFSTLTCPYCVQTLLTAMHFLALEGDQAEVVKTLSIGVTHAIGTWIISTKTAKHISNKRGILLLLPSIMGKWHISHCLFVFSFLVIITSGKKPTNLAFAGTVPVMRWVLTEFMASGHNFSTHNSRSMERELHCTAAATPSSLPGHWDTNALKKS